MNCILIEDEIPAQQLVKNYISKLPEIQLIAAFQSALEANSFLQRHTVDLIFLDINLPDINGLKYIRTLNNPPRIIMTTAYPEHAAESFELDSICDYLVKPFSFDRFLKAVNKAKNGWINPITSPNFPEDDASIFVNIDKTLHKIQLRDILYLESDRNYITIVTSNGKFTFLDSLKIWLAKLPNEDFLQVHKSYIINYRQIQKIKGNLLYLKDYRIPLGRTFRTQLRKRLNLE
ncbi:MAG: LytTR family DNA-binding domain-containing protein [Eudoraea sp.]|nr:LytTR family DNA-binding domain-containing protein [Eudoraea sp.]